MTSPIVLYNAKQVKREEIDEPFKLLDPKWKGKIVINDPLLSSTGYSLFRHLLVTMGPKKATEFYKRIRAQAGTLNRNQRRQIEWVVQGKYPILLGPSGGLTEQFRKRWLKFEVLGEWKDIGIFLTSSSGTAMLINKAPHPNAAAVFINWGVNKDGQTAWSKSRNQLSRRLDVSTDHLPPYIIPRTGGKYWNSSSEENRRRSPEEQKIMKDLFGG